MLEILLLSPLTIQRDGQPLKLPTRRTEALFVYLLRNPQPHARDVVATLFWDDLPQQKALGNLRVLLSNLRKHVGPHVTITRQTVAFNGDSHYRLDLADLERELTSARDEMSRDGLLAHSSATKLAQALEAYQGDLLPGFYLQGAQGFAEWLTTEREWLWTRVTAALGDLADTYLHLGDYRAGLEQAQRLTKLDPLREEGHQQLMQLWAADGQINAALAQYDRCVKILDAELGVPPKSKTVALFDHIRDGTWENPVRPISQPIPPGTPISVLSDNHSDNPAGITQAHPTIPNNLPREMTPFIGRVTELEHLKQYLLDPAYPLVTLVAEGGSGKTRLALGATRQLIRQNESGNAHALWPGGIWFVSLAALHHSHGESAGNRSGNSAGNSAAPITSAIASAIASEMGLLLHGQRPVVEQLKALLQERRCLLILDNFEQLIPPGDFILEDFAPEDFVPDVLSSATDESTAVDLLIELMEHCPQLHLLVTSRIPLDLNSEFVVRLGGLPVPEVATGVGERVEKREGEQANAAEYDSVRLFVERATRVAHELRPEQHLSEIGEICRLVSGLPLGIELAAARSGSHTPMEILLALQANFDLLTSRRRDIPPRQRSMRAVFDHSWHLLTAVEQQVLAQAACFSDGFTYEAAQKVILFAHSQLEKEKKAEEDAQHEKPAPFENNVAAILDSLVHISLLQQDGIGRYRLHTLLREYAAEKLAELSEGDDHVNGAGRWQGAAQRHSRYYLDFVQQGHINGWYTRADLAPINADLDNVRQGWRWASDHHDLVGLTSGWLGMWHFYEYSTLFQEGEESFHRALVQLQMQEPAEPAPPISDEPTLQATIVRLQVAHANFLNTLGRYKDAAALAQPATAYAKSGHDIALAARGYAVWGTGLYRQAQTNEASTILAEGLAAARAAQLPLLEAKIHRRLANTLQMGHDFARARSHYQDALALNRQHGHRPEEAEALTALGWCYQQEHDLAAAIPYLREALEIHQAIDNPHGSSMTLINLGVVYNLQQEYDKATACHQQIRRQLERFDNPYQRVLVNHSQGVIRSKLGDYESAESLYQRALVLDQQLGDPGGVAWTQNNLGLLHNHLGNYERALALHQGALQTAIDLGATTTEGLAWSRLGQDYHGLGELEEAYDAYLKAIAIQEKLGQTVWAIESKSGLAATQLALNLVEDAMSLVEEILAHLAAESFSGAREPMLLYWNCYQVLKAVSDARASEFLESANQQLTELADKIKEPQLRRSFVENVPVHRALRQELM